MVFDITTAKWLDHAVEVVQSGKLSNMQTAKTLRIIGQIFEARAREIEFDLVDRVENRLYNTNTETKGATHA